MIIEKNIGPYVIFDQDSIANALRKISRNRSHFVFCVNEHGHLEGILTNGDFLRWVVNEDPVDLDQPAESICNREFESVPADTPPDQLQAKFSSRITVIPLVNDQGRLVAVALPGTPDIRIGEFVIAHDRPTFVIAEIGINHNGSVEMARRLVDEALAAGADCAKFQMRHMASLYRNQGNPDDLREDIGSQYTLDLLSRSLLSDEEMFEVFDYCRGKKILPLCTPWDLGSVAALESYGMEAYKVASADLTNHDLLRALAATHKPLIISTGMSTEAEIRESVTLLRREGAPHVLLHCNSTYPAPFKDVNLKYLDRLQEVGECPVGYSGHERGYAIPLAAVARGARVIEKHFTLDRSMEGNDHRISLLPSEFRAMVDGIRNIEEGMGSTNARVITQGERMNRETLGKSIVAACEVKAGTKIDYKMLIVRSPGKGIQPNRLADLVGRIARRDLQLGDYFYSSDLGEDSVAPRAFEFRRPWGVPVRYHDYRVLRDRAPTMDLLEFHLSYKDMDQDLHQFFDGRMDFDLMVHSPDLFAGDHLLNLAEEDQNYRERSLAELQRAIDVARELKSYFSRAEKVKVIASLGGFSKSGPIPAAERTMLYDRVAEGLERLDKEGVELLPQTLPPFPWYFGGQLFCNIFVDAEDTAQFCQDTGYRLCFDVSHSKLTCNHRKSSFAEFVEMIAPHSGHLHIVDAADVDGEGLQIGEGDIDFAQLANQLDRHCPEAAFIPEIWQGHKDGGEGFWCALDRLEKWF